MGALVVAVPDERARAILETALRAHRRYVGEALVRARGAARDSIAADADALDALLDQLDPVARAEFLGLDVTRF
jgi:hypothetical protein